MDTELQRRRRRERLYNTVHRGFVTTCMIVTGIATLCIGQKIYEYFRYVRPLHAAQHKKIEEELLQEGRNLEESSDLELST